MGRTISQEESLWDWGPGGRLSCGLVVMELWQTVDGQGQFLTWLAAVYGIFQSWCWSDVSGAGFWVARWGAQCVSLVVVGQVLTQLAVGLCQFLCWYSHTGGWEYVPGLLLLHWWPEPGPTISSCWAGPASPGLSGGQNWTPKSGCGSLWILGYCQTAPLVGWSEPWHY